MNNLIEGQCQSDVKMVRDGEIVKKRAKREAGERHGVAERHGE